MRPLVSVVMPAYNVAPYLGEAIQSICSQSFGDFELIIVDDGSTDKTVEIAHEFGDKRIRVLNNEKNSGLSFSLNRGLDAAHGSFIARMDGDDIALPTRFEEQLQVLQNQPEITLCGTYAVDFNTERGPIGERKVPYGPFLKYFWWRPSPIIHPSAMWRIHSQNEWRYDMDCWCEDFDLWLRMGFAGCRFHNIVKPLLNYRVRADGFTGHNSTRQFDDSHRFLVLRSGVAIERDVFLSLNFMTYEVAPRLRTRALRQIARRASGGYGYWHARDDLRYRLLRLKKRLTQR